MFTYAMRQRTGMFPGVQEYCMEKPLRLYKPSTHSYGTEQVAVAFYVFNITNRAARQIAFAQAHKKGWLGDKYTIH